MRVLTIDERPDSRIGTSEWRETSIRCPELVFKSFAPLRETNPPTALADFFGTNPQDAHTVELRSTNSATREDAMPRPRPEQAHLRLIVHRDVHRKAKATAVARGQSMSALVSELIAALPDDIHFKELEPAN